MSLVKKTKRCSTTQDIVDEFEPKTGEKEDIIALASCKRRVLLEKIQQTLLTKVACLQRCRSKSHLEDNEYMVFVEMDRNDALLNNLFELVDDIHPSGKLQWKVNLYYPKIRTRYGSFNV